MSMSRKYPTRKQVVWEQMRLLETIGGGARTQRIPVEVSDDESEEDDTAGSRPHTPPPPRTSSNPATPSKRRFKPKGILLGTWKGSGLHADHANAVFGSRDFYDRINRPLTFMLLIHIAFLKRDI